jgi:hypothetical protein
VSDYDINPWRAVRPDAAGKQWFFKYDGGSSIKIRPYGGRSGDWTYQIQLVDYNMTPSSVPKEWLAKRAAAWIEQRDADLAAGLVD